MTTWPTVGREYRDSDSGIAYVVLVTNLPLKLIVMCVADDGPEVTVSFDQWVSRRMFNHQERQQIEAERSAAVSKSQLELKSRLIIASLARAVVALDYRARRLDELPANCGIEAVPIINEADMNVISAWAADDIRCRGGR